MDSQPATPPTLEIRNTEPRDIDGIIALYRRVYPNMAPYSRSQLQGHLSAFPEGQFIAEYDGEIVGFAATFITSEKLALKPHTWAEITGAGYASRHDPNGDWLYGMEVAVDPKLRNTRIGRRIYDARKRLCEELDLKGIVFGGRMPSLARRIKQVGTPEAYLEEVLAKRLRDPVIGFQMRAGFEPIGILKDYTDLDPASLGHATHMVWRNPYWQPESERAPASRRDPETVRVAAVQFQQRNVKTFEEFIHNVEYFVDVVSDYKSDFVVFPELFTLQLLAFEEKRLTPAESIEALTRHTPRFIESMRELAMRHNVNIIAGSHPTRTDDDELQNVAYIFLRDGSVHLQEKIHPTPNERYWWNFLGGDEVRTIPTDCGPIGVMICYDSEFPEIARRLVDEGARLLFVPFNTDTRQGYLRVRYCAQARAIENQCYVVTAGAVGNLPGVENSDIHYAQSAILTPCDFPFARDGIAAETSENVETMIIADLSLADLARARAEGSVMNLKDRRFDLYRVAWTGKAG